MKTTNEDAVHLFHSGLNCAQSVLISFSEKLKFDKALASGISLGFGSGMGRLQETCGAVTGAFMAIGIYHFRKYPDIKESKDKSYQMVREFNKRFTTIHGSSQCIELLKCDLKTEEGQRFAKENNLFETVCENCVSSSVKILDDLLRE